MPISVTQEPETRISLALNDRVVDILSIFLLLAVAALILVIGNSSVPMQLWDESRNANNALEMSRNGHWLVTYYRGLPDHWNTKPPLLIWVIALLLRLGLPPLLALRLPSITAGFATVMGIFVFCRYRMQDRAAGLFAGLTLLTAPLFAGWHAARTGDYDSLVTLFTLTYALAFWEYLEARTREGTGWLTVAGVALMLSVLTKGVGGVLALPALLLYAVLRRRLLKVVLDWRVWLVLCAVMLVCGGYYGLREHFDPGYLEAVRNNEFTGRYLSVNEQHHGGPLFYVRVLATRYEPGLLLLPFCVVPFFCPDRRRRSLILLCVLVSGFLLAVLSRSQTKLFWYIAPATPFMALASGIGLSEGLRWLANRKDRLPALLHPRIAYAALTIVFCGAIAGSIYYYQFGLQRKLSGLYMEGRYGPFLELIRQRGLTNDLMIADEGTRTIVRDDTAGLFLHYSPEAQFYAELENSRGMRVHVITPGGGLLVGSWVATCDPRTHQWLNGHYDGKLVMQPNKWCALEHIAGAKRDYGGS